MKKFLAVAAVATLATTAFAQSDNSNANAFTVKSESGELVHVMPNPVRVGIDPHARGAEYTAPVGATVYRASYGSGGMQYYGGKVITGAKLYNIYGDAVTAASLQTQMDGFVDHFGGSVGGTQPDYNIITQYSRSGAGTIANTAPHTGSYVDAITVWSSYNGYFHDTTDVPRYLNNLFAAGVIGAPDSTTVYTIFLPKGVISEQGGSYGCGAPASQVGYCAYHFHYKTASGLEVKYAIIPWNDCWDNTYGGCLQPGAPYATSVATFDSIVVGHEIREAVTDPMDGGTSAWRDIRGYEADDKCAWHNIYQMKNGGYWVQPEYSNANKGCVVP